MSTGIAWVAPTGRTSRCWSARSSFAWTASGSSPDLVEEERAAVGASGRAPAAPTASVKAPFSWPNSSLSMMRLGQRAAVHRHEGAGGPAGWWRGGPGPPAPCRYRSRPAISTWLSLWQQAAIVRDTERMAIGEPEQPGQGVAAPQLLLQLAIAAQQAAALQRLAHGGAHPMHVVEGLRQVVEGPAADAADRALDAGVAGHHDDLHLGMLLLQPLQHVEPAGRAP